jgi:hypothetical protein
MTLIIKFRAITCVSSDHSPFHDMSSHICAGVFTGLGACPSAAALYAKERRKDRRCRQCATPNAALSTRGGGIYI